MLGTLSPIFFSFTVSVASASLCPPPHAQNLPVHLLQLHHVLLVYPLVPLQLFLGNSPSPCYARMWLCSTNFMAVRILGVRFLTSFNTSKFAAMRFLAWRFSNSSTSYNVSVAASHAAQ